MNTINIQIIQIVNLKFIYSSFKRGGYGWVEWRDGRASWGCVVWWPVYPPHLALSSHSGHRVIGYYKYPQQIILISALPTSAAHRYLAHKLTFKWHIENFRAFPQIYLTKLLCDWILYESQYLVSYISKNLKN